MISASKEFKEKLKNGANIVNYADITLSDGTVLHLEPKDFMIGGCQIDDKTTDGKFGVGFVIGKTLSLRISNHEGQLSRYNFYNSIINLYAALLLDDGTIEKIRKGVYYTLVPETPGDIIEISAVDGMYKLDKDYAANSTVYPATLQKIITDVCLDCGIPIGFTQFDNMAFIVQAKPENATTYRQVLSWACQISGYNARIDNAGYMKLIWYNESLLDGYIYNGGDFYTYPHDTVVDGGDFKDYTTNTILSGGNFTDDIAQHISKVKSINVHTDDIQITGVKVYGEEDAYSLFGEEGYVIEVKDNPFSAGRENEIASYLGNRMVGMVFRPFSAEILNNPLYEPFEVVRVSDAKGNVYLSLVNSITYKIGSFTRIACEAEGPARNGSTYVSAAAQAVAEARRNSQKQISEYDKAVQNMSELAMNALGFFETVEIADDGSRIAYMHDKPALEESTIIYKRSIDGFFVSQDGGESYTGGFDSQGNAILNVIYAIGIVADWIRSGRLECKKGNKTTFLADVDTGEVRIVADFFSLSSGDTIDSIAKEEADNAVNSQTQADIFNRLTNNGKSKGIYMQDGELYVNATYIRTGEISADRIHGGTMVLGGSNNSNGKISIRNSSNTEIGRWDNEGIYVNGGSVYCKTDTSGSSIYGGRVHLTYGNTDVGYIGTNYVTGYPSHNGVVFDLEYAGAYMAWAAKEASPQDTYTIKMLYANKSFSNYVKGNMYISCDFDFRNYEIKNAYINELRARTSFEIPNNVDCDIFSHVDFHNFEIQNVKINNLVGVNGNTPYDGKIYFISQIENIGNGNISWTRASATLKDGIVVSVSSSAQS